jgi:hypothetical protein
MRRILAALTVLAFTAPAALAAQPDKAGAPGTNVEMPYLIAPLTKDGKLLGYAYIQSHLVASSQTAALEIGDKLAFIQDAFVRDVNGAPIGKAENPTAVDIDALNARLTADAQRIVGAQKVDHMDFTDGRGKATVQTVPLHPDGTTLNMVPPSEKAPDTAGAAAAQPASAATSDSPPTTSR